MAAELISESESELVIQVTIPKSRDFVECEELIQNAVNEGGQLATKKCLESFDTDGSPIVTGGQTLTAKSQKVSRKYETPYGIVAVERYAYQTSAGGQVFIPLDSAARIIAGTTPRFAKMVSYLYAHNNAGVTMSTLEQTNARSVSKCYIQDISEHVAAHVEDKNRYWNYADSEPSPGEVGFISIGIDGTCLFFCDEGYRQAMVGTIAFYDPLGERLHTTYIAASPEYGKETFLVRMDEEIGRVKNKYRDVRYIGVTDGATDFRPWLELHTTTRILDFWHVTEYINDAAAAIHRNRGKRNEWIDHACHSLKHKHGASHEILDKFKQARDTRKLSSGITEKLNAAISYFENNLDRMNYASYRKSHLPIGSGVTEAACKTVVKQRMCGSGMSWKKIGADAVLTLRSLALTKSRWAEFWQNAAKFGF
jgi:hypothetical protein